MQPRRPLPTLLLALLALGCVLPRPLVAEVAEAVPAAPGEVPEGKPKLFFHGLAATTGVSPEELTGLSRLCATELGGLGLYQVIGDQDIAALLGLEARQQLLGCDDDGSCLAELAGSLGAERVIYGDVSRYGKTVLLNLTLLDSADAAALGRVARKIEGAESLEPVISILGEALRELARSDPKVGPPVETVEVEPGPPARIQPREKQKREPGPAFQLRALLRLDLAYNLHSGSLEQAGTTTPTADYYSGGAYPGLGVGMRLRRLDLTLVVGWAGNFWKTPAVEYNIDNVLLNWRVDVSYDIAVTAGGTRWELGAGALFGVGPGGHAWAGGEWPLVQKETWGFDLFATFDIEYQDWTRVSSAYKPSGLSLMVNLGGAFRYAP